MRSKARQLATAVILLVVAPGCAIPGLPVVETVPPAEQPATRVPEPPIDADSGATSRIAPGVVLHSLYRVRGPWAIHVLDVDRTACWMPAALKRNSTALGRATTSSLLGHARGVGDTVAAVNADFFLFSPPGVPTGPHVDDAVVIAGPGARPALVVDSAGRLHITHLSVHGTVVARGDTVAIDHWNHLPVPRLTVFDERWGVWTDTSITSVQAVVGRDGVVARLVRARTRAGIPRGGWVIAGGANAPARTKRWLASLRVGDTVSVRASLAPVHPLDAVGGFPLLVRDSARARVLDSAHVRGLATTRHPRTAVGIADGGRRLFLVVVDGRQPGYSAGMTLPELADLMLELGSRDALNLDGGGSSTMAVRLSGGDVHVVNRPSDRAGERAVANALAIVRGCMR